MNVLGSTPARTTYEVRVFKTQTKIEWLHPRPKWVFKAQPQAEMAI